MPHLSHTTDRPLISQRQPGALREWDSNPRLSAYEADLLPLQHPAINWRFFSEERLTSKPLAQVGLLFVFRYVSHVLTQLLVVPRSFGTLRILFEPYAARVKSSIKPSPYTLNHYCSIATERVGAPRRSLNTDFLCGRADSGESLHVPGKVVAQRGFEPTICSLRGSRPSH